MLHIHNGDSVANTLRGALPGEHIVWCDTLHDGPCLAGLNTEEWRTLRAAHHAAGGWGTVQRCADYMKAMDDALESWRAHDEIVLWFEHDLFDQLILIRLLDYFAGQELGTRLLTLVTLHEFPGVTPFYGLGQLNAEQLATLFPQRCEVSPEQFELAHRAWQAFTATDPMKLQTLMLQLGEAAPLAYLGAALERHFQEFPSLENGLARTERQILQAVADGAKTPGELFNATQAMEERPFLGDTTLFNFAARLGRGPVPLLLGESGKFQLTAAGRDVLTNRADNIELNGCDRWLGGVQLQGGKVWRWDVGTRRLHG